VLVSPFELTVALTIGVVIVAIRPLQLYEATYGLTMLRLASLVSAAWIGIVFVLLGLTIPRRGLPIRWFPAAVILSGLIVVGMWSISDPVSIVAQTNLRRAEHGQHFEVIQAASLGPDAEPTLVAGLQQLDASQATELRHSICARSPDKATGTAFNVSRARANKTLARACGPPG
jgi:hypothetical protein